MVDVSTGNRQTKLVSDSLTVQANKEKSIDPLKHKDIPSKQLLILQIKGVNVWCMQGTCKEMHYHITSSILI